MQNSLERIFEGTAASLRDHVLPEVADPYAKSQVAAAIELLGNLATRVEWRSDQLEEEIQRIRGVLAAAPDPPALVAEPVPTASTELVLFRRRHLDALAALQESASAGTVGLELRAFLAWQLERELALLRTGMYK
jgi:hypothetical protein